MKKLLSFLMAAVLLTGPALAAACAEVVPSDGGMCRECALGDLGADALRSYTGADIALFASGDLGVSLQPGEIDEDSLAASFPRDGAVTVQTVTADQVRALLEESVAHIALSGEEVIDEDASAWEGFFCVSGFTFSYDASAPAGERIVDLDLPESCTLAAAQSRVDGGEPAGTIRQAVAAYCEGLGTVAPPAAARIRVLGAGENKIIGGLIPRYFVIFVALVAIVFGGARYRRRLRTER